MNKDLKMTNMDNLGKVCKLTSTFDGTFLGRYIGVMESDAGLYDSIVADPTSSTLLKCKYAKIIFELTDWELGIIKELETYALKNNKFYKFNGYDRNRIHLIDPDEIIQL